VRHGRAVPWACGASGFEMCEYAHEVEDGKEGTDKIPFDHFKRHREHLVDVLPDVQGLFLPSHPGEPGREVLDCDNVNQNLPLTQPQGTYARG
jgi:hypothetical protein